MPTGYESILVVDDDRDILVAAKYLLERHYRKVVVCSEPDKISRHMSDINFDVILLDMNFHPGESDGEMGLTYLKKILNIDPEMAVVIITAHGSINIAVEAMKRGAIDYLNKPWDNERLLATLSTAINLRHTRSEASRLRQSNQVLSKASGQQSSTIIGTGSAMQAVKSLVSRAAPTDANVLILGENGTGKELIARAIHQQSARSDEVFIPVDLGSISESLFESELFGHVKGAFTGAKVSRIGYIEAANGGSLFLDEIGNLPLHLQAKLLSVLEKREVAQVGSSTISPINVRIIAATNMPLAELTNKQYFRQDLLFRLNTVEITLPPLRERRSDIPDIACHYTKLYCSRYSKRVKKIDTKTMDALVQYQWPGNVRALRHAIERAVILSEGDNLRPDDFQFKKTTSSADPHATENEVNIDSEKDLNLDRIEYRTIIEALRKNNYVISHTAKDLGLTRAALYRRMEKYGI